MAASSQAFLDLERIAPAGEKTLLSSELRRFDLAIDSALRGRSPQASMARLVNEAEPPLLSQVNHNMRMRMLVGLRPEERGGRTSDEAQMARMRIYSRLSLGDEFIDASRREGHRIARRFYEGLDGADLNKEWAGRDADSRLDIVGEFLQAYHQETGYMPPTRLETDRIEPDAAGRIQTGEFRPDSDTLWLNEHPHAGWDNPVDVMVIAGHETAHKVQQSMAALLVSEQRPDLVSPEMVKGLSFNSQAERIAAWYFFDNNHFGHITTAQQEIGYKYQPIEVHARIVEGAIRQTLNQHMLLGKDAGLITGVSAGDLEKLGLSMDDLRADRKPDAGRGSAAPGHSGPRFS